MNKAMKHTGLEDFLIQVVDYFISNFIIDQKWQ